MATLALSIRQPWADAILYAGKDVENRTWPTRYRGPVLIHAAKAWGGMEKEALIWIQDQGHALARPVHLGGIVGRARIADCVSASRSPWFFGPYGFVLADVEPLPFQPCRGALGFFEPTLDAAPPTAAPSSPRNQENGHGEGTRHRGYEHGGD